MTTTKEVSSRKQSTFFPKHYQTEKKGLANRLDSVVELTDMEQQLTGTFGRMVSR